MSFFSDGKISKGFSINRSKDSRIKVWEKYIDCLKNAITSLLVFELTSRFTLWEKQSNFYKIISFGHFYMFIFVLNSEILNYAYNYSLLAEWTLAILKWEKQFN